MAYGDKDAGAVERAGLSGDRVLEANAHDLVLGDIKDLFDDGVPDRGDLLIGQRPLRHDAGGTQGIPAMDQVNLGCEPGQVHGLLTGGVTPADHHKRFVAEYGKSSVAGSTVGNSLVLEFMLARGPKVLVPGSDGDDDTLRLDHLTLYGQLQRGAGEINRINTAQVLDACAEAGGLLLHFCHKARSLDAVAESGEVFHDRGGGEESSRLLAGDKEGIEIGACCVNGGGPSGATGSDNDDVFHERRVRLVKK